jgi:hypothetical protein
MTSYRSLAMGGKIAGLRYVSGEGADERMGL